MQTSSERQTFHNRILAALGAAERAALQPQLHPVTLAQNQVLQPTGTPTDHVTFVERGIVSLVTSDGNRSIEIGLIGPEGVVGANALLGDAPAICTASVQVSGFGFRMESPAARAIAERSPLFREFLMAQVQIDLAQAARSAFCNSHHRLAARCARWLLMCLDRLDSDDFPLTHDYLSRMLGVSRPNVTVAVNALVETGAIRYTRGHVVALDRARLEQESCGCDAALRDYDARLQDLAVPAE